MSSEKPENLEEILGAAADEQNEEKEEDTMSTQSLTSSSRDEFGSLFGGNRSEKSSSGARPKQRPMGESLKFVRSFCASSRVRRCYFEHL